MKPSQNFDPQTALDALVTSFTILPTAYGDREFWKNYIGSRIHQNELLELSIRHCFKYRRLRD